LEWIARPEVSEGAAKVEWALEVDLLVKNTNKGDKGSLLPLFLLILPHFLNKNPKSWL